MDGQSNCLLSLGALGPACQATIITSCITLEQGSLPSLAEYQLHRYTCQHKTLTKAEILSTELQNVSIISSYLHIFKSIWSCVTCHSAHMVVWVLVVVIPCIQALNSIQFRNHTDTDTTPPPSTSRCPIETFFYPFITNLYWYHGRWNKHYSLHPCGFTPGHDPLIETPHFRTNHLREYSTSSFITPRETASDRALIWNKVDLFQPTSHIIIIPVHICS